MQKKTLKKIVMVFITVLGIASWYAFYHHAQSALEAPVATLVKTTSVHTSPLALQVHAIGALTGRSVEITPEVPGHIDKILFTDGAFVRQGTVLIELDDAVLKARYESATAQLAYSESDYHRKALLAKEGAIAKSAVDEANADLKEKRANADENAVMMNKMKLTAPFDGVVGKSKVNLGDYVTIGQSLVTLTDTKQLRVEYNVPEQYLASLKRGQVVKITTAVYPGSVFTGQVAFISPTINTDNRSISLYAIVPNDRHLLASGMFVDVNQSLGIQDQVLMIPVRSLVPVLDGEEVYKVIEGKAYAVNVLTGKRTENDVEVTQGLKEGDVVITDGQLKVKTGMPVKVTS